MSIALLHTRTEIDDLCSRTDRATRAVVMTMGALHEGHAALIREARTTVGDEGTVMVTVYVNALQFNDATDLERYPRTLEADVELAANAGADVVWAPQVEDVFPNGAREFTVDASQFATPYGALGEIFEGEFRPGHFTGMLTVVRALLTATNPALALFGEKDYQQLALIRRMVAQLHWPVQIVGVPTVREVDGLALSSRNQFLNAAQRTQALALSSALHAAAKSGKSAEDIVAAARGVLAAAHLSPDYIAVVGENFTELPVNGAARILIACKVGDVRLIDNAPVLIAATSVIELKDSTEVQRG